MSYNFACMCMTHVCARRMYVQDACVSKTHVCARRMCVLLTLHVMCTTQASKTCHVSVLETVGSDATAAPTFLLRSHLKNWSSILGMGYNRVRFVGGCVCVCVMEGVCKIYY